MSSPFNSQQPKFQDQCPSCIRRRSAHNLGVAYASVTKTGELSKLCGNCKTINENELKSQLRQNMFNTYQKFRESEEHCDIIIVSQTDLKEYPCHRLVLAAESCYFRALFRLNFADSNQEKIKLDIEEPILEKLLLILYQQPVECGDDVVELFYAASYLQMENILSYLQILIIGKDVLKGKTEQLLKLGCSPELESRPELLSYVQNTLHNNFLVISQSTTLYQFPLEILKDLHIINNAKLFKNADTYINFIGKWIYYDFHKRMPDIHKLIKIVDPTSKEHPSLPMVISQCENMKDSDELKDYLKIQLNGLFLSTMCAEPGTPGKFSIFKPVTLALDDPDYTKWVHLPKNLEVEIAKWRPFSDEIKFTIGQNGTSPSEKSRLYKFGSPSSPPLKQSMFKVGPNNT